MEPRMFDKFLAAAVKAGASDIHIKTMAPPTLRVHGVLKEVKLEPITDEGMAGLVSHMLDRNGIDYDLRKLKEHDTSYFVEGVGRFRVNILKQKGHFAAVLRVIPRKIPSLDELGLPSVLKKLAHEERGLILVTGVTGSGKSTTLAAMINEINAEQRKHIVTIEDPIEFLHEDKLARITQREVGADTESFAMALRAALRQDPDVILVGEMRDAITIDTGLKAAETGHLVFSTVHTTDAAKTIGRIIDVFPHEAQNAVRIRLAENLKGTISQRLLRKADGQGRVVAMEIMVVTLTAAELIKDPARTPEIKDYIERSREMYGTQSFDQHLIDLYQAGVISLETARQAATNPADFERALYVN
ncbi:MAG: type IV pilus twitching motility protein PilT [Deltaproteobacteria bacterium]|jgi:twitching motility protein PilT|nr:type IV pilus twitching motility protein PilT [Deltaproteobacteria bacterium]